MKRHIAGKQRVSPARAALSSLVLGLAVLAGCVNVNVPEIPQIPRIPNIPGGNTDGVSIKELGFGELILNDGRTIRGWWRHERERDIYEMHEAPTTRSGRPDGSEPTIYTIHGRHVDDFEEL